MSIILLLALCPAACASRVSERTVAAILMNDNLEATAEQDENTTVKERTDSLLGPNIEITDADVEKILASVAEIDGAFMPAPNLTTYTDRLQCDGHDADYLKVDPLKTQLHVMMTQLHDTANDGNMNNYADPSKWKGKVMMWYNLLRRPMTSQYHGLYMACITNGMPALTFLYACFCARMMAEPENAGAAQALKGGESSPEFAYGAKAEEGDIESEYPAFYKMANKLFWPRNVNFRVELSDGEIWNSPVYAALREGFTLDHVKQLTTYAAFSELVKDARAA
jgi:hypothetical protein